MDVSRSVLAAARERYPDLSATEADVRRLPFPDGFFEPVVSNCTLDRFDSRAEIATALRELNRVLQPRGLLIVSLDNLVNPLVALRNALPFRPLNTIGLVPYYVGPTCGPRGLRKLLAESGFEVERRRL